MRFLSLIRKNMKLTKLMKRLVNTSRNALSEDVIHNMMNKMVSGKKSDAELAEEELYDLVVNDPDLSQIMRKYGANRSNLKDIYHKLILHGAGQWAGGGYIPAAAIATIPTLDFLLREVSNSSGLDEYNKWLKISYTLITYYQSGKMGRVE